MTVTNSTLSGNNAVGDDTWDCSLFAAGGNGYGGAIYNAGTANVSNSTFSGNSARGGWSYCGGHGGGGGGGGIYHKDGTATLTNVSLSGNSAIEGWGPDYPGGAAGGGIFGYTGTLTITNSSVYSNTTSGFGGGGGIYNRISTATLTNVTLSGNSASFANGGGIYNNFGMTIVTNVTLSSNSASTAGGIHKSTGTVTLTNTIVANSTGGNCSPSLGGNFNLSDDNTCGFGAGRDNANVMLGPLANNGGPTLTRMLLPGSPAIDFGTNTGCPSTDQRGAQRPQNGICDVGAVEGLYLFLPLILK